MASQHRRPSARHRVLPAALCAGIVALAGCGGGSSLASQADSICKTYNAKFNALPRPTASTLITYLDRGAALLAQGTAKLRALKPPGSKSAAYQSWLTALGQELAVIQRAETTAKSGNTRAAVTLLQQQAPSVSSQARAKAQALGFKECAA